MLRSQAVQLGRSSRERGTGTGQCEERQVEKLKTTAGKIIYLCTPGPRPQEEAGQAARGSRRGTNRPKLETRLGEVKRTRGAGQAAALNGNGDEKDRGGCGLERGGASGRGASLPRLLERQRMRQRSGRRAKGGGGRPRTQAGERRRGLTCSRTGGGSKARRGEASREKRLLALLLLLTLVRFH